MTGGSISWRVLRLPSPWKASSLAPTPFFDGSPRETQHEWPERKAEFGCPERLATHQALPVPDVWQALCCRGMEARGEMPTVWRRALLRGFAEPAIRSCARPLSAKPLSRSQKSLASGQASGHHAAIPIGNPPSAIGGHRFPNRRNPADEENGGRCSAASEVP